MAMGSEGWIDDASVINEDHTAWNERNKLPGSDERMGESNPQAHDQGWPFITSSAPEQSRQSCFVQFTGQMDEWEWATFITIFNASPNSSRPLSPLDSSVESCDPGIRVGV